MLSIGHVAFVTLLAGSAAWGGQTPDPPKRQTEKTTPKQQQKAASMTGCVDQQDGRYVLIDERSRNVIAGLEADGFPTEGFAKHLGHKVTVRGTSNAGSAQPLFKVRAIDTISDQCAPQRP